jgi:hypothetical protein
MMSMLLPSHFESGSKPSFHAFGALSVVRGCPLEMKRVAAQTSIENHCSAAACWKKDSSSG